MSREKIAVVIPCYRVAAEIEQVVRTIPEWVDHIIVVDDRCPQGSGKVVESLALDRAAVIYHDENQGVGAATVSGYRRALELGCDIAVKMDGDGQMDPRYLDRLVQPLLDDEADYCKGNRFTSFDRLKAMPKLRLFGNSVLSFLVKFASGYWDILDPTNGYTAIHRRVLERLDLSRVARRYFLESDMLIRLNVVGAVVADVDIPARYGQGSSSLSVGKALIQFPFKLAAGLIRRVFFRYFVYDFNMASVYILLGLPMFLFSVIFGVVQWIDSLVSHEPKTAGTIMLVALPIIVSFQMLLQSIQIDINSTPRRERRALPKR